MLELVPDRFELRGQGAQGGGGGKGGKEQANMRSGRGGASEARAVEHPSETRGGGGAHRVSERPSEAKRTLTEDMSTATLVHAQRNHSQPKCVQTSQSLEGERQSEKRPNARAQALLADWLRREREQTREET